MEIDAFTRAALSEGHSNDAIHLAARRAMEEAGGPVDRLLEIGCGRADLARTLDGLYRTYVGSDLVGYPDLRPEARGRFFRADLNRVPYPVADACVDAVVSLETIEHLENPRAMIRELARALKPGGLLIVSTPNQLSLLSKMTLLVKNQFNAFQDGSYPAHITALLEVDLVRLAEEAGLEDVRIRYTDAGRIPFTGRTWPRLPGMRGRAFSDNILLVARRRRGEAQL